MHTIILLLRNLGEIVLGFTVIAFVPLAMTAQGNTAAQRDVFSPEEIKNDLKYLYSMLESTHYDLYVNTSKKVFDSHFDRINKSIDKPMNTLEVTRLFQPFAALSKLAHCSVEYPFARGYRPFLQNGGKVFPFDVRISGEKVFIRDNYSGREDIAKGDEIISIEEVSAKKRLKGIYDYLSGESEYFKNSLIDLISFPRVYWMVYDQKDSYRLTVKKRNGRIVKLTVNAVSAAEFEEKFEKKKPIFNSERIFKFLGKTAYLHPGPFVNKGVEINTSEHKTFDKGEFLSFLEASFTAIQKSKPKSLIIDLRGNPGGDNSFSDVMTAYFATKPFRFCSRFSVRTSEITKTFWKDVNDPLLSDLKSKILSEPNGSIFDSEIKKYPPRTDLLRFDGNVYVLINRYSYSNAASTAALIQDYGFGKLIGEQTADTPTTFGAVHQFKLPNTQISVTYPKSFIIRPNGDKSAKGVTPDFMVEDDFITDEDVVLNFALAMTER